MKYIGTYCFPRYDVATVLKEKLNEPYNYHNQFRIVCKARGLKHANELTDWVAYKSFKYDYCSETGNEKELSFFEQDINVNFIICGACGNKYITDFELMKLIADHPTEKGGSGE
jgi:hypothetical protein